MSLTVKDIGKTIVNDPSAMEFSISHPFLSCYGCYSHRDQTIYVWGFGSTQKGMFKAAMSKLTKHFHCTTLEFTILLNDNLTRVCRGFQVVERDFMGEPMKCLRGEWKEGSG